MLAAPGFRTSSMRATTHGRTGRVSGRLQHAARRPWSPMISRTRRGACLEAVRLARPPSRSTSVSRGFRIVVRGCSRIQFSPRPPGSRRHGTIHPVKRARPPLAQPPKGRAGGRSGLHRATQQLTAVRRVPQGAKARIRATETSRFSSGETGNLCVQQHQVGGRRPGPGSPRVDGIEPCWRQPAQTNGGHGARARKGARDAQNPAYRPASHKHARHAWTAGRQRAALPHES